MMPWGLRLPVHQFDHHPCVSLRWAHRRASCTRCRRTPCSARGAAARYRTRSLWSRRKWQKFPEISFKLNSLRYSYTASPEDDLCSRSWSTSQCGSLLTGGGRHQIRSKVPLIYAHCESQQSYWQKVTWGVGLLFLPPLLLLLLSPDLERAPPRRSPDLDRPFGLKMMIDQKCFPMAISRNLGERFLGDGDLFFGAGEGEAFLRGEGDSLCGGWNKNLQHFYNRCRAEGGTNPMQKNMRVLLLSR